jgi:hypothetical protein
LILQKIKRNLLRLACTLSQSFTLYVSPLSLYVSLSPSNLIFLKVPIQYYSSQAISHIFKAFLESYAILEEATNGLIVQETMHATLNSLFTLFIYTNCMLLIQVRANNHISHKRILCTTNPQTYLLETKLHG